MMGSVYFLSIKIENVHLIKIGWTNSIKYRIPTLNAQWNRSSKMFNSPCKLSLLGIISSKDRKLESYLHGLFCRFRYDGEYFFFHEEIEKYIKANGKILNLILHKKKRPIRKKLSLPFAHNLKKLLVDRDLSFRGAAEICDVNQAMVYAWAHGTVPHNLFAVKKLCDHFSVNFEQILVGSI